MTREDDEPEVPAAAVPPRIGELLDRVVRNLGAPGVDVLEQIFGNWPDIAGDLAGHARPVVVQDGLLVVAVDEPARATELRFRQGELLDRLEQRVGPARVTRVEVRVRPPG